MAGVARSVMEWRVGWLRRVGCSLWLHPLSSQPSQAVAKLHHQQTVLLLLLLLSRCCGQLHAYSWLTYWLAGLILEACSRRRILLAVGAGLWPACTSPWPPAAVLTRPHLPAGGAPAHAGTRAAAGDDTVSRARLLQARPCLLPPAPHLALLPCLPSLSWPLSTSVFSV